MHQRPYSIHISKITDRYATVRDRVPPSRVLSSNIRTLSVLIFKFWYARYAALCRTRLTGRACGDASKKYPLKPPLVGTSRSVGHPRSLGNLSTFSVLASHPCLFFESHSVGEGSVCRQSFVNCVRPSVVATLQLP